MWCVVAAAVGGAVLLVPQDQHLSDLAAAEAAVTTYAGYYNYHRLHGEIGWHTPAERFDGTPFSDRGFEHVPTLAPVADVLAALLAEAA